MLFSAFDLRVVLELLVAIPKMLSDRLNDVWSRQCDREKTCKGDGKIRNYSEDC